jgi:hypothetical protein
MAMIRKARNFKRSITGCATVTELENALMLCLIAFAMLGSFSLVLGKV